MEPLAVLFVGEEGEPIPEDLREIALAEEMVVVVAVDDPVPRAALSGVVAEPGRETGEKEVPSGGEEAPDLGAIPRPVALPDMVETAGIDQEMERPWLEWKGEGIGLEERKEPLFSIREIFSALEGQGLQVHADALQAQSGSEKEVPSLAAPQIQRPPPFQAGGEPPEAAGDKERRLRSRPGVIPPGIRLGEEPTLAGVDGHVSVTER